MLENQEDLLAKAAKIRLVLTDLDETLVYDGKPVGERSAKAIALLQEAGVTVAVCTGRAPQTARPVVNQLGVHYFISNNGATVYSGDQMLVQREIPAEITDGLVSFFEGHDLACLVATPTGYFLSRESPVFPQHPVLSREHWRQACQKVHAPGSAYLYEECTARFGDQVHPIYHPKYVEVAPLGISKRAGAQVLADLLGLQPAQVAHVGDGQNDLEAVRWAGLGCAMGNADPLLKAAADWVLPPVTEDGAASMFELILAAVGK